MSTQTLDDVKDFHNLSDDEISQMTVDAWLQQQEATSSVDSPEQVEPEETEEGVESLEDDETPEAADEDAEPPEDGEAQEAEEGEVGDDADDSKAEAPAEKEESKEDPSPAEPPPVDYEAEYKRLLAPFKANGREIAVKGVDDAIALMQMGANYNKKMAALKPNLRLLKMLEKHQLLDEQKLGYLIDLDKKNPDAIRKLVSDSGIDPMEIDTEKGGDYKPNTYKVDDREIELDAVLEEIQDSPSYSRTIAVIGNQWDTASKKVLSEQPQLIKVINDHIDRGIFDLIVKEMESERVFGRLNGLSDLDAYRS